MHDISFSQARAHLAKALLRIETENEPALICRRGQTAAVLMSVAQFQRLSGPPQDFAEQLAAWRRKYLAIADDPWAEVRNLSPGRDFAW